MTHKSNFGSHFLVCFLHNEYYHSPPISYNEGSEALLSAVFPVKFDLLGRKVSKNFLEIHDENFVEISIAPSIRSLSYHNCNSDQKYIDCPLFLHYLRITLRLSINLIQWEDRRWMTTCPGFSLDDDNSNQSQRPHLLSSCRFSERWLHFWSDSLGFFTPYPCIN